VLQPREVPNVPLVAVPAPQGIVTQERTEALALTLGPGQPGTRRTTLRTLREHESLICGHPRLMSNRLALGNVLLAVSDEGVLQTLPDVASLANL